MGFSYNKLWKLLIDKNMKKNLQCAIATTPKTIAKMGWEENVSLEILYKNCHILIFKILKNIKKLVIDYKKDIMILGIIATRKGVKIWILNLNAIKTL